jgi:hypothetical protein
MMQRRIKFQVLVAANRWKTVYVLTDKLRLNVINLRRYGFKFRIGGDRAGI